MKDHIGILVRVANCQDVAVPHREATKKAERAMTMRGKAGEPDIILFSEVATVDIEFIAGVHGFSGLQFGSNMAYGSDGDPESGTAIAVNREVCRLMGDEKIVKLSSANSEVRDRYAISDKIRVRGTKWRRRFWAIHLAPPRTPDKLKQGLQTLRSLVGAFGGDTNSQLGFMQRLLVRRYLGGEGVLGLACPRTWKVKHVGSVDIGSDHMAEDFIIWVPIKRRFRRG